jgi:hypothetical protein
MATTRADAAFLPALEHPFYVAMVRSVFDGPPPSLVDNDAELGTSAGLASVLTRYLLVVRPHFFAARLVGKYDDYHVQFSTMAEQVAFARRMCYLWQRARVPSDEDLAPLAAVFTQGPGPYGGVQRATHDSVMQTIIDVNAFVDGTVFVVVQVHVPRAMDTGAGRTSFLLAHSLDVGYACQELTALAEQYASAAVANSSVNVGCSRPGCGRSRGCSKCAFTLCGACGAARYCSAVCRRADWRHGHKGQVCAQMRGRKLLENMVAAYVAAAQADVQ